MPYRINSKQLFLTYPQCNVPKQNAADFLCQLLVEFGVEKHVVAEEVHQNGDPHLHAYFKLERPVNKTNHTWADIHFLGRTWHGNYQGCRSAQNVLKYCTKKENYVADFDVAEVIKAKKDVRKVIAEEIITKKRPLVDLLNEYPHLIFGYNRLKADVDQYWRDKEDQRVSLPMYLPNPWGKVLPTRGKGKRRHYWVFSRQPNMGKTYYFARPLIEEFRIGSKSGDFTYWNLRGDEEAIVLDEYNTAILKYNYLNSMCDGSCEYRIFQGGVKSLKNPIIIVLSNQSISEMYPFMNQLLYARFNEIEIV